MHGARRTLVLCNYEAEWTRLYVERFAVHRIGDQHLAGMEFGIDLGQRDHRFVPIGASRDHILCEGLAVEIFAMRDAQMPQ